MSARHDGREIHYTDSRAITVAQFADLLRHSTLAERRPVEDEACLGAMLAHADILATAWDGERLVGVARSLTDFAYCCYLSDLAVDAAYQHRGIGRALIVHTEARLGTRAKIILLSAPAAVGYYPKIGFTAHPSACLENSICSNFITCNINHCSGHQC
jgi:ribosomal protein S18 acetylase RimI-like enzyme